MRARSGHVCRHRQSLRLEPSTSAYSVGKQARLGIESDRWFSLLIFFFRWNWSFEEFTRSNSPSTILCEDRRELRAIENGVAPSSNWCCSENRFFPSGFNGVLHHSYLFILLQLYCSGINWFFSVDFCAATKASDICALGCCSRFCRELFNSDSLWESLARERWPYINASSSTLAESPISMVLFPLS